MTSSAPRFQFRPDIEGLRAVAVLLVVGFHAGVPRLGGGFIGVDVFFVISGYLITALLADEIARTNTVSLPAFYARRIRRLLPAAAVVLCATLALSAYAFPPLQMISTAVAARAAAAYVSNVHFVRLSSDYFSGDVRLNPALHTWSLAVEEQFYLVWPALLLVVARIGHAKSNDARRRRLAWTLVAVGTLSFVAACWYVTTNPSLAFYAMPLRAWEFAAGGVASFVAQHTRDSRRADAMQFVARVGGCVGLAAVVGGTLLYSSATEFPGASALLPVIGTVTILIAGAIEPAASPVSVGGLLSAAPLRWIGQRSYSWYLWHWPLLVLGESALPRNGVFFPLLLVCIALLLADLTYRFVETPMRAPRAPRGGAGRPSGDAWRTIQIGIVATVALVAVAEGARRRAVAASQSPLQLAFATAADDKAPVYADGCINYSGDERVHVCEYGVPTARTRIALFGDSHAAQWLPALEEVARARGWSLLVIAKTHCATADVAVYVPITGKRATSCERWRSAAIDTLRARHPSVVVLSNAMSYVKWLAVPPESPAVTINEWEAGMRRTVDRLHDARIPSVVIQDTPQLIATVLTCLSRSGWIGQRRGSCGMDRAHALSAEIARVEQRVVAAHPEDHVIDFTDILCRADACGPIVGGMVAYQDGDHLTATMSRTLAPIFASALDSVVTEIPDSVSHGTGIPRHQ